MTGQTKLVAATTWQPTTFQLWHGRNEPPPHRTFLHAGSFTAYLESADLRDLRFNGVELVRRLYFALRDENWDTIPGKLENLSLDVERDRFQIAFDSYHCNRDIEFRWHGIIRGDDATISYTMSGKAIRAFRYCRIGFCVLHPPGEYAGRPFSGRVPQRSITGTLPTTVGPQRYEGGVYYPLFDAVSKLTVSLSSGVEAEFDFVGDLFEMEDQRNWTDGSFKTYCTPLALGYPHSASAGQAFAQRVGIMASGQPLRPVSSSQTVKLSVGQPLGRKLPQFGLGMATHDEGLSGTDAALLRCLGLHHLRVDLHLKAPDFTRLDRAARECSALGCSLELAIFLTNDAEAELGRLKASLPPMVQVARVLVFHENEQVTSQQWIDLLRDRIAPCLPGVPLAGGTNLYFAELNRSRPKAAALDAVAYSINPQVHATDERSLVENLEAQRDTVESARTFCGDLPIAISPVTLKPRFNPDAVGPEAAPDAGELPSAVDARQMSLFAAAWTLGSIKQLAEGGTASVTYYETTGWRGIKEVDSGCPAPELFCSSPGVVFPVYHVLADVAGLKAAEIIACTSADPLRVQALALRVAGSTHLLVANLTAETQTCEAGPLAGDRAAVRSLDAASAREAMTQPLEYRARRAFVPIVSSTLTLELAPYSVTRVDLGGEGS